VLAEGSGRRCDVTDSCPKCGFAREPKSVDCPVCGIVFARYRPLTETSEAMATAGYSGSAETANDDGSAAAGDRAINPYAAPRAPVLLRREVDEQALASRGSRLAARFVDGLILVGVVMPAAMLPGIVSGANQDMAGNLALAFMFVALLALGIVNLVYLARDGQTLGKKALKVRIVMLDGEKARLGRILIMRIIAPGLLGAVPVVGPIFAIVNILFIFGAEQRCLHDHFAGTKVVVG
jgi:uncharacterized RDD family membrane protein YckC